MQLLVLELARLAEVAVEMWAIEEADLVMPLAGEVRSIFAFIK